MFFSAKRDVFLSLFSKHVMLRMMLVMDDVSLFTIRHYQHQMQILVKIEIKERVFSCFCLNQTQGFASEPVNLPY